MTSRSETLEATVEGSRVRALHAGDADQAVLCVHGLASSSASLGPLVEVLAEHGYRALAPDLRGHGDSEGPRGRISRQRVLADLHVWADRLDEAGVELAAIVGHSLGGLWALAASDELDPEVQALVATPVSIRNELGPLEVAFYRVGAAIQALAGPLGMQLRVPNQVDLEEVLASEEAIETARRIELVQSTIPLANAGELLALDGRALARQAEVPTIVARPREDELVAEASTRRLFEALAGPRRWLELDGPHECFFDRGGREAAETLAAALASMLDDKPT